MIKDLRFALRMLRSHRWFSFAVIVTLGLGIGINTTVFTLVNAVLFKPVPIAGGDRLITVSGQVITEATQTTGLSWPDYLDLASQNQSFEQLEAMNRQRAVISETEIPPERYSMAAITPGMFSMIKTPPLNGRSFGPDDGKKGAEAVILLGHHVWQKRYHGADVVGRTVRLNGQPATIIGVMPTGFRFPDNEDLWTALRPTAELERRDQHSLELFGLLHPGISLTAANSDLAVIAARLSTAYAETNENRGILVQTFHEAFNGGEIRIIFLMMLVAVGFVLLIACANVANMLFGRAIGRSREISLRAALGASRWQIVRQLLIESIVLSSLGGLLGLALATGGTHAFDLVTRDVGRPYWLVFNMDWVALTYFAIIAVGSGIVFGLLPALRASRFDLNTALKESAPGAGSGRNRLTAALVVLQFALTVVLLASAGMMVRSFFAVQNLNAFVRPDTLLTARLQLPEKEGQRYHDLAARRQFFDQLLPRIAALPGVTAVTTTSNLPGGGSGARGLEIAGRPNPDPKTPPRVGLITQSPNYLSTIEAPLLTGRGFAANDGEPGREVAIVSRAFAARFWPNGSPLEQRIRLIENGLPGEWLTIIGICADIDQQPNVADAPPVIHVPYRQAPWGWMGIALRTVADPVQQARALRGVVQDLDPDLPLYQVETMREIIANQHWFLKLFGTVFGIFALTGLLMASVGIYGVIAQSTARRTREIGVRMALGASTGHIARLVLRRGLTQLSIGLALGLVGAFASTRLLGSVGFLVGISPHDPFVFIGITLLLLGIGLLASWLPARRAARISPTTALRAE